MAQGKPVVTPGELLTSEARNWLHGKGTYVDDGSLLSSLCGEIQMMDRMVRVEAANSRYVGAIGDCVVGRVVAVAAGRWRVDVGSFQDAALLLQNVNLPGGHLRRKTAEDQRQMRELFKEHDVLSAEVQKVSRDGSLSLHTRSTRYGKLSKGTLIQVPAVLIKRLKTHFHAFECGIEALIGVNGLIWLSPARKLAKKGQKRKRDDDNSSSDEEGGNVKDPLAEKVEDQLEEVREPTAMDRMNIARLRACALVLSEEFLEISPATLMDVFSASENQSLSPAEMLQQRHRANLIVVAEERIKGAKKGVAAVQLKS
ncbi:Exosome complex component rrp4 [Diplonema papillatum]|nr:Exosome complex component rrp4 [Diplonema papillatum]